MCVVRAGPLLPALVTLASAAPSRLLPEVSAMSFLAAPSLPGPVGRILTSSLRYQLVSS